MPRLGRLLGGRNPRGADRLEVEGCLSLAGKPQDAPLEQHRSPEAATVAKEGVRNVRRSAPQSFCSASRTGVRCRDGPRATRYATTWTYRALPRLLPRPERTRSARPIPRAEDAGRRSVRGSSTDSSTGLFPAAPRSVDKPLVATGRGPYRRSCPKGLTTPTPDQGAIPNQAVIETPSGRKATADHGPATADDDRDCINAASDRRVEMERFLWTSDSRTGVSRTTRRARHLEVWAAAVGVRSGCRGRDGTTEGAETAWRGMKGRRGGAMPRSTTCGRKRSDRDVRLVLGGNGRGVWDDAPRRCIR